MEDEIKNMEEQIEPIKDEDELFERISELIENARNKIRTTIDTTIVYTYYGVGSYIVNFEQGGKARAEYGKGTIKRLSERLNAKFEKGWSVETLKKCRKFFLTCLEAKKVHSVDPFNNKIEQDLVHSVDRNKKVYSVYPIQNPFTLSWSHYLVLMRIENPDERSFYEIEAVRAVFAG